MVGRAEARVNVALSTLAFVEKAVSPLHPTRDRSTDDVFAARFEYERRALSLTDLPPLPADMASALGAACDKSCQILCVSPALVQHFDAIHLNGWMQSPNGTVVPLADDLSTAGGARVLFRWQHRAKVVLLVDAAICEIDTDGYRVHREQVYDRFLYPRGAHDVRTRHVDARCALRPVLVDANGVELVSAFQSKTFTGGVLDLGTLRFEHARAVGAASGNVTAPSEKHCQLRFEAVVDDRCVGFMILPVSMLNSGHTCSQAVMAARSRERAGVTVDESAFVCVEEEPPSEHEENETQHLRRIMCLVSIGSSLLPNVGDGLFSDHALFASRQSGVFRELNGAARKPPSARRPVSRIGSAKSDYELKRDATVKRNAEFLERLGLAPLSSTFAKRAKN